MEEELNEINKIRKLRIKNFKSVKDLELECRRINVFIGEPNTGKSNILETLGLISCLKYGGSLKEYVRFDNMMNLFFDMNLSEVVEISFDNISLALIYDRMFRILYNNIEVAKFRINQEPNFGYGVPRVLPSCKFYRFKTLNVFPREDPSFLYPPHGNNLATLLLTNREMRILANDILKRFNLKLIVKPIEKRLEVQKEMDWIAISYPYQLISDTLQRIIFYLAAIETNKESILIFEEPESNAFPFYTKFLAERIALDESNQYFISTHNPYLLIPLLSKAPINDIQVFVTYLKDNQTQVKALSDDEKSEILDLDASVFFDIERFLEG